MELKDLFPDTSRRTADQVTQFLIENPAYIPELLDLSFYGDGKYPMRAARVVFLIYELEPGLIKPFLAEIFEKLILSENQSVVRSIMRVYVREFKSLSEDQLGRLISFCFKKINTLSTEIAIRVICVQILYEVSVVIPEIKPELKACIENYLPVGTTAFKSHGEKTLRKLNREIFLA